MPVLLKTINGHVYVLIFNVYVITGVEIITDVVYNLFILV